jgi:hypothetical protein
VQVLPAEETACDLRPIGSQYGRLAEGVVDVPFDDVARVVKDRADIIVGVLGDVQPLVEGAVTVRFAVAQDQGIYGDSGIRQTKAIPQTR